MTSAPDFAVFSLCVYSVLNPDDNRPRLPLGWSLAGPVQSDDRFGFSFGVFRNSGGEIVVAYTGTNQGVDWISNIGNGAGIGPPQATAAAPVGKDDLDGGAGNDLIDGGGNDDKLVGGSGDDTLRSGERVAMPTSPFHAPRRPKSARKAHGICECPMRMSRAKRVFSRVISHMNGGNTAQRKLL